MIIKGQKISDRYQIIRTIGEGGMANVYLAYDTILNRDVAVKVLRGDLASDEKFVKKFQREAISASSLSHPNIVEMYDVGEDNGNYFIVMEFIDGKTLKNLIKKRGALTLPEVIDIMLQLTSAIMCAHDSYIIHRDIKPQNVMILDDGRVKITDFGIAIAANANELTQTNSVMGSVHYLPPEQANGNGATIKSDIYSLGILMFELLTGRLPFKGETAVEVALKQLKSPIPSVCRINSEIPQSVENIIIKACAKNPKNRYNSVNEMHEDIKTCLLPERANERRHNYEFSEQDLEETKTMPNLENMENILNDDEKISKTGKKSNLLLWILGTVFVTLIITAGCLLIFLPESSTIKVPNVIGLTEKEATSQLVDKAFSVVVELEYSDDVDEGLVIRTKPSYGTAKKEGSEIVIVVSKGPQNIPLTIENYKDEDATKVKNRLEAYGIVVIIETRAVDDKTKYKDNLVIEQSIKEGEVLKEGDEITLFIADLTPEYPNFTKGYTVSQVEEFCLKYEITLKKEYQESFDVEAGKIISQDKPEGYLVRIGEQTLTIVIATKPVVVETPSPEEEETP